VLLGAENAVISDELNHASIIDGIRLCRARRLRYRNRNRNRNRDIADLKDQMKAAAGARCWLIVTHGVFSMDGYYVPLDEICRLADRFDALFMADDSHAVGFAASLVAQPSDGTRRTSATRWSGAASTCSRGNTPSSP